MKKWMSVIILLLCAICGSCKPKENLKGVLSTSDCGPSCWLNLKPGVTTEVEARQELVVHPKQIKQESIFEYGPTEAYSNTIGFSLTNTEKISTLFFTEGVLNLININTDKGKMKLEEGFELFGYPDQIVFQVDRCTKQFIGQAMCLRIYLYYPQKGLILSYEYGSSSSLLIDSKQEIDKLYFFPIGYNPFNELLLSSSAKNIEWPGYTFIENIWDSD